MIEIGNQIWTININTLTVSNYDKYVNSLYLGVISIVAASIDIIHITVKDTLEFFSFFPYINVKGSVQVE